ncbi:hypothetical protein [Zhihengliuella sp.]|uniref:hypothetical protein n=1 Tax=Zhihengliuella sp. TaxID=1954483 RepID=UPI002810A813|nr:hypothetical protein [Zhihengliuella sp.]
MHEHNHSPQGIDRRTVAKGAAWSLPVLAAAVSAPLAAASPDPTCPECFTAGSGAAFSAQAVVLGNTGTVAVTTVLNVSTESCADLSLFQPAYTAIMTAARLTMSDGTTYSSALGLGTGAGTFGAISAFNYTGTFSGIPYANDALPPYGPTAPARLCVDFNMVVVGLPSLLELTCPVTLCWDVTGQLSTGTVIAGAGTVNHTGLMTGV